MRVEPVPSVSGWMHEDHPEPKDKTAPLPKRGKRVSKDDSTPSPPPPVDQSAEEGLGENIDVRV